MAYYKMVADAPFGAPVEHPSAGPDATHMVDLRDLTFPDGGFSVKMINPLMDYHVAYTDPDARVAIEFEHRSVHPPHRFTPGEAPCLHNPHLDQLGHNHRRAPARGRADPDRLLLGTRPHVGPAQPPPFARRAAEGGPRARVANPGGAQWREIERERGRGRIQYIFGHAWDDQSCDTGFLSFVRTQDGSADGWSPLNMGWLLQDGEFTRLDRTKSRMKDYRDPATGWSAHMEVDLVDSHHGRPVERILEAREEVDIAQDEVKDYDQDCLVAVRQLLKLQRHAVAYHPGEVRGRPPLHHDPREALPELRERGVEPLPGRGNPGVGLASLVEGHEVPGEIAEEMVVGAEDADRASLVGTLR